MKNQIFTDYKRINETTFYRIRQNKIIRCNYSLSGKHLEDELVLNCVKFITVKSVLTDSFIVQPTPKPDLDRNKWFITWFFETKFTPIFLSFKRPFSFWNDVSMTVNGKLVNGKVSPCVCKQIPSQFYICAVIIILLCFLTIYRIIFYFRKF